MKTTTFKPSWIKYAEEKFGVKNIRVDHTGPTVRLYRNDSGPFSNSFRDQSENTPIISWEYEGKTFRYSPIPDIVAHNQNSFPFSTLSETTHYDIDDILQAIKASVEGKESEFDSRSFGKLKAMQRIEGFDPLWHREINK